MQRLDLSGFNPQQLQAIGWQNGPCLVLATAGSGKTACLIRRIARLIDEGVPPGRILAATFTKKASDEMLARLIGLVGEDRAKQVWIGTFHSICLRILKISAAEMGLPEFTVLPPYGAIRVARDVLAPQDAKHPFGMHWRWDPKAALSQISRAKADLVDVVDAERWLTEHTNFSHENVEKHVRFWGRYEQAKAAATPRELDFDDLLLRAYQLLSRNPEALERWQDAFDFVHQDETQDTNIAQQAIAELLSAEHHNYYGTGDVDQSIYEFRGSNVEHTILSFQQVYPEGRIIKLGTNYRSSSNIVRAASSLIKHNGTPAAYTIEPESARGDGLIPEIIVSPNEDREGTEIARRIAEKIVLFGGVTYKDVAVLYRTNAQSRALEDAFVRMDIPYVVNGSSGFYERKEVKDALAYLQLAHDPSCDAGDEALKRIVNIPTTAYGKPAHKLGKRFITQLETTAEASSRHLWDALYSEWSDWEWFAIKDLIDFVKQVKEAGPEPSAMIERARVIGYDAYLARENGTGDDDENTDLFENLEELVHATAEYANVATFLDFVVQQRSRAKKLKKGADSVQLLTGHRAKGLEWPIVFIAGVAKGLLPHKKSLEYLDPNTKQHIDPESIKEERRLAYVAMTRAKDELVISAPLHYQDAPMEASPFLFETGLEVPEILTLSQSERGQLELARSEKMEERNGCND